MSVDAESEHNRRAALEALRFHKAGGSMPNPSSSSSATNPSHYPQQPAQSRDATRGPVVPSRYFANVNFPPAGSNEILVPDSSPLGPSHPNYSPPQNRQRANGLQLPPSSPMPVPSWQQSRPSNHPAPYFRDDALSAPSGFTNGQSYRPHAHRPLSSVDGLSDDSRPRKRINRGPQSSDAIDLTLSSPEVSRPSQRRRVVSSSDDSELPSNTPSNSLRRIGGPPDSSTDDEEKRAYTKFRLSNPQYPPDMIDAAWKEARHNEEAAIRLLQNPSWKPKALEPTSPTKTIRSESSTTGRVKEVEEAHKAQRAAVKEKSKKSSIYANRLALDTKNQRPVTPPPKPQPKVETPIEIDSPVSPVVAIRRKRIKRVVDSESEVEGSGGDDSRPSSPALIEPTEYEARALEFFNTSGLEELQELTGVAEEQAAKIIAARPFKQPEDINAKLNQTKKKAGSTGISFRIFEDTVNIMEGYAEVDRILEKCENIGARLRTAIATWTAPGSDKGKEATLPEGSIALSDDVQEDGALTLRSRASFNADKKNKFLGQPSLLADSVTLKEYQLLGVNWLNLLHSRKLSCILADEMGLGKTVQVISFFALLKERGIHGPHLIVVPSSTLENWCREFSKFAPSISVQTYYASKEERPMLRQTLLDTSRTKVKDGWEVLITTYALAQGDERDRKFFKKIPWETCVFDEGHMLKNFESERYRCLLKYQAEWRLLLTGTPLQNNLQELVSLMNFILPEQFAKNMESLRTVFKSKGDAKVTMLAKERVSRAKKMMTPFVLRRRKDQVLGDLPKKFERIEWCEMTALQKKLYNDALRRSRKTVMDLTEEQPDSGETKPGKKAQKKGKANGRKEKQYVENSANVLMDLRKAASHPMLFRSLFTDDTVSSIAKVLLRELDFKSRGAIFQYVREDLEVMTDSELQVYMASYKSTQKFLQDPECYFRAGKVKTLLKLLKGYMAEGRRVLIFSQFTQVLDILQAILKYRKIKYLLLTGSTAVDVRQSLVDEFNEDDSITVFLLSTKAGGMGINLTSASVVVMFDQDFNPHNDRQAQDRAYRIGQKRDVDVVKLITRGTVEEDMLKLSQMKLDLDEAVAGDGDEQDTKVESEMKKSLMKTLRQKFEDEGESNVDGSGPEDSGSPLTDMEVD